MALRPCFPGTGGEEAGDIDLIVKSGLFDEAYYRSQVRDTSGDLRDLVTHYHRTGAQAGCEPNRLFCGQLYLDKYPDVAASGMNPLAHFLRHGAEEGRSFSRPKADLLSMGDAVRILSESGLFDSDYYSAKYSVPRADALAHYVQRGAYDEFDPNPVFRSAAYLRAYADVASLGMNPLLHYLIYGVSEGRDPAPGLEDGGRGQTPVHSVPLRSTWRHLIRMLFKALDLRIVRPGLPNRIGHLVKDFDAYLKERLLAGRTRRPIYIVDAEPCNRVILDYWRRYLLVIEGKWAKRLSWLLQDRSLVDDLEHDFAYTLEGASPCFAIETEWRDRPPLFSLTADHAAEGEARLREMGVPAAAWFVCVHVREGGYSPSDQGHHAYRDADINNYLPAMEEIVRRGGWCIRMGDATMTPLPPMPGLIDYPNSPFKSDLMDVFLCARCRFFLGTSSGLFLVSSAFGVPSALSNMAPLGCSYGHFRKDISIPKLYLSEDGRAIPFASLIGQPIADFRWSSLFEASGVRFQENTPDEILDLAREMLDRLDGTYVETDESKELQHTFRNLFSEINYSWRSPARIGDAFLKKHRGLLADRKGSIDALFKCLPWKGGAIRNPAAGTRRRGYQDRATAERLAG
ncbi:MAG: TIGR04372 family glycosyltransferase [Reyranella sp.]|nr:TIGR04372 family glycosyltransferase [Reyranella sp.]